MPTSSTELAIEEIDQLITLGNKIIMTAETAQSAFSGSAVAEAMAWATRSGQIIRKVSGEGSFYDSAFVEARKDPSFSFIHAGNYTHLCEIQGALQGLQHAVATGLLQDLRRLVQADVFADFLEMAEHLLAEGYKDAAAVLVSGVLEDALRKLSDANNLPVVGPHGKPLTIEPLNVALMKAGIYQPLTKKQITSWADLRNNAAHGDYNKYSATDAREMLLFVQRFCADFLQ